MLHTVQSLEAAGSQMKNLYPLEDEQTRFGLTHILSRALDAPARAKNERLRHEPGAFRVNPLRVSTA